MRRKADFRYTKGSGPELYSDAKYHDFLSSDKPKKGPRHQSKKKKKH